MCVCHNHLMNKNGERNIQLLSQIINDKMPIQILN